MTPEIPHDQQPGRRQYKRRPKDPRRLVYDREILLYGGHVRMLYNDALHLYWIEEDGEPGRYVTSTTSVTKIIDKPALINWAVNQTVGYLRRNWLTGKPYRKSQIEALLARARDARLVTSRQATDIGTLAHDWCERYALAAIAGVPAIPELPYGSANDDRARLACEAFMGWVAQHEVEFLAAEKKVFSRELDYSGTFDLMARVDGKLTLVDFKTSKRIYDEYELQLAGYAAAVAEEQAYIERYDLWDEQREIWGYEPDARGREWYREPVDQGLILHIPKNGDDFSTREVEDLGGRFDVFRSCLEVVYWQKGIGPYTKEATERRISARSPVVLDTAALAA